MSQLHHNGEGNLYILHTQRTLNCPGKTLIIGHSIIQSGFFHFHHNAAKRIDEFNAAFPQVCLALFKDGNLLGRGKVRGLHTALVSRGNIGHKDHAIGNHFAVTAQAPAGFKFFCGDMAGGNGLQLTFDELYAALAAGAVTGAGRIDGNIAAASQFQQIITGITLHHNRVSTLNLEGYFHIRKSFH